MQKCGHNYLMRNKTLTLEQGIKLHFRMVGFSYDIVA